MNKMQMAHEYMQNTLKYLHENNINFEFKEIVVEAFDYADAMQAEADKRENKDRPDILKPSNPMELDDCDHHFKTYGEFKICSLCNKKISIEWQPDWSQAPEWAGYFAMDEDGEFYYFEQSPSMASRSWQPQSHGEVGETFNHSYKGNWQDSLRKRPQ